MTKGQVFYDNPIFPQTFQVNKKMRGCTEQIFLGYTISETSKWKDIFFCQSHKWYMPSLSTNDNILEKVYTNKYDLYISKTQSIFYIS